MLIPIFVYGTLMKGQPNHKIIRRYVEDVKEGHLQGYALYNLGAFPGAVEVTGEGQVFGQVLFIDYRNIKKVLAILDQLEGYSPNESTFCLYFRRKFTVYTKDGAFECWGYLFNTTNFRFFRREHISGGRWQGRRQHSTPKGGF